MKLLLLCVCAAPVLFAQAPAAAPQSYENLNAVVWMQTAAEYRAAALGTYRAAEASLSDALADRNWTAAVEQDGSFSDLPPAVILDLDETVLDNSVHQAELTATHGRYSEEGWTAWVGRASAGLVPGAARFLAAAHGRGVAVFYVTNRVCNPTKADDPTVTVLRAHSLPFAPERLLCKTTTSDKTARRTQVVKTHRVIELLGDDLGDFIAATPTPEARFAAVGTYDRYWGQRWFVLPNPTYGSWERTVGYKLEEKLKGMRR